MFDKKQNEFVLGFGAEHQQAVSRINWKKDIPMHCLHLLQRLLKVVKNYTYFSSRLPLNLLKLYIKNVFKEDQLLKEEPSHIVSQCFLRPFGLLQKSRIEKVNVVAGRYLWKRFEAKQRICGSKTPKNYAQQHSSYLIGVKGSVKTVVDVFLQNQGVSSSFFSQISNGTLTALIKVFAGIRVLKVRKCLINFWKYFIVPLFWSRIKSFVIWHEKLCSIIFKWKLFLVSLSL